MKTLIIKDKIINNKNIKSNEFVIYLGLVMLLKKDETIYYANTRQIAYLLTKTYPPKSTLEKKIISGISQLVSDGVISYYNIKDNDGKPINQDKKEEWLLNLSNIVENNQNKTKEEIHKSKEFYTPIDENDIYKILNLSEYYTRSISLLHFYCYVLSTIFKSGKNKGVGFTSLKNMSEYTGLSARTISSYLDTLVEKEFLYIYKSTDFIKFDTGEFVEISHTYGKYQDKEIIIDCGKRHEAEYSNRLKNKYKKIKKPNKSIRSYTQQYAYIKKSIMETGVIPYDDEKMEEVYNFIKKLNKKQQGIKGKKTYSLDVFSNYYFYEDD